MSRDVVLLLRSEKQVSVRRSTRVWGRFDLEVFGLTVDLSGVSVSPYQSGFGWVVYVLKYLTINVQLYAKCSDLFPCSSDYGDDLDFEIFNGSS